MKTKSIRHHQFLTILSGSAGFPGGRLAGPDFFGRPSSRFH
jgi:hypothetical protein